MRADRAREGTCGRGPARPAGGTAILDNLVIPELLLAPPALQGPHQRVLLTTRSDRPCSSLASLGTCNPSAPQALCTGRGLCQPLFPWMVPWLPPCPASRLRPRVTFPQHPLRNCTLLATCPHALSLPRLSFQRGTTIYLPPLSCSLAAPPPRNVRSTRAGLSVRLPLCCTPRV